MFCNDMYYIVCIWNVFSTDHVLDYRCLCYGIGLKVGWSFGSCLGGIAYVLHNLILGPTARFVLQVYLHCYAWMMAALNVLLCCRFIFILRTDLAVY